ncbi:uncharacterized protein SEPMUDRAFT_39227, partial [Sphaerulina musiva SO2202]
LGVSATIAIDTLRFVRKYSSFRPFSDALFKTAIICSSIDRPDTTYILKRIL